MKHQKTYYAKSGDIKQTWVLVDAKDQILGRVASQIASLIRGKSKVDYTPSMNTGDFVVVINADKVKLTGKKEQKKKYYRHTMYPKGLKCTTYAELQKKDPARILSQAVWGMLPKNKIGRKVFKNMKIYCGDKHPHEAQSPDVVTLPIKKGGK